jgi:ferredoxin
MRESLRFAEKGQIAPFRMRTACQFCDRPAGDYQAADILLGVIGVDAGKRVLVLAHERDDARFKLHKVTDRVATERETVEREVAVWKLSEMHRETADRQIEKLGLTGGNLGAILGYLSKCTLCGDCLNACPLCAEAELNMAFSEGHASFISALIRHSQRLMSCSTCGMCQAHCPEDIPLCAINRALAGTMQKQAHYVPGRDPAEPLPWQ